MGFAIYIMLIVYCGQIIYHSIYILTGLLKKLDYVVQGWCQIVVKIWQRWVRMLSSNFYEQTVEGNDH